MSSSALQSLKEGELQQSLDALQESIRSDSSDPKKRIFLFQLLAVIGNWGRAGTQLEVAGEMDASAVPMVQMYREALRCEMLRAEVFAGRRTPLIFGEPTEWLALLLQSFQMLGEGRGADAAKLRARAFEEAPTITGSIDGTEFEWIADGDMRLGPVLEAIVNGNYYWIPFDRIKEIHMETPEDLRDFVWTPAQFVWPNEGQAVGLIPTRYPGSEASGDDLIRLARKTEWVDAGDELFTGLGQRLFATDSGDFSLLDIRQITMHHPDSGDAEGEDTAADE